MFTFSRSASNLSSPIEEKFHSKSPLDSFSLPTIAIELNSPKSAPSFLSRLSHIFQHRNALEQSHTVPVENAATRALLAAAKLAPPTILAPLYTDQVLRQRLEHGNNDLSSSKPPSGFRLLRDALLNPFNFLLTALAIIAIGTGDFATFSVMMVMVVTSTALRFVQERRSVAQGAELQSRITSNVSVLRHSGLGVAAGANDLAVAISISRTEVVVGDLLLLVSGDLIPADCVLVQSSHLLISTSVLTGEIFPIEKSFVVEYSDSDSISLDEEDDVIHAKNVLLAGTSVSSGEGIALVVQTGDKTYVSTIASMLKTTRPINAFQRSIRHLSYLFIAFMLVMSPTVLIIQGELNKSAGWTQALLFALSVAVGLTPEVLPLIIVANLSRGAIQLARRQVIVKRLDGVQVMGSMTCLCSDKTGTLTVDEVSLSLSVDAFGKKSVAPLSYAYLNAALQTGTRSLLDLAIVNARDATDNVDISAFKKLAEVPFDSARRLLSVSLSIEGKNNSLMITKGAVEEVLRLCTHYSLGDDHGDNKIQLDATAFDCNINSDLILDSTTLSRIRSTADDLNNQGLRLVAVARRIETGAQSTYSSSDEHSMVFLGFLAFLDPPKEDAASAVADLISLGVKVKVLTGDASIIAVKVARDIGLLPSNSTSSSVLSGAQITILSAGERGDFIAAVKRAVIFAQLSPFQKLEVIEALRDGGDVVGMLGDGVNDALALRGADVGISVDTGSEVAKDSADIILLEKSLSTIVCGVRLGRVTLLNTVKYVQMASSSNFGNVFSVLAASAWLPYQPMLPLQILMQNLLYDLSQASIPWDNVDPDYVEKPVKFRIWTVARFMFIFGPISSIFDIVTFSINWWYYNIRTDDSDLVSLAQTNWFIVGFCTQLLVIYFLRTGKIPFLQSSPSRPLVISTLSFLGIAISLQYIPKLNVALSFTPVKPDFYGYLTAIIVTYCLLVSIAKLIYQRVYKTWF